MSEQENNSGEAPDRGSPVVVVESASSKHTLPYRPTDLEDEGAPDLHQKRAPAVALTENWKDAAALSSTKELRENEYAMSSERNVHAAKKLSSNIPVKKRESLSPVPIPMTPIESESKTSDITSAASTRTARVVSPIPSGGRKEDIAKHADTDSITSEITELRSPEVAKKTPEWSDEEEAGGLPRSESRASRVTRAVRQLFCCGVQLEAPSEDNVSEPRSGFFNSGI